LKAITLWQPWASLIVTGAKKIETRSWSTRYRGPLAIHAAQTWNNELDALMSYWHIQGGLAPLKGQPLDLKFETWAGVHGEDLPKGCIIAICDLIDCRPAGEFMVKEIEIEKNFGDFTPGRFGWILSNVRPLENPIYIKGSQGLWNWDDSKYNIRT
jgi:hypothetical protein